MSASQNLLDELVRDGYPVQPLTKIHTRLIDTRGEIASDPQPVEIFYQHSVLCQVGLPRKPTPGDRFERTSGNASLLLKSGELWTGQKWELQPLPHGVKPRLALIHICSEAIREQSRTVSVGASVRDFLRQLDLDTGGHEYSRFRRQMRALAACQMKVGIGHETIDTKPIRRFSAWLDNGGTQPGFWSGEIELTQDFFVSLTEHAVPIDRRALCALRHSALALDVYVWLAHRLYRITSKSGVRLSWQNLHDQFGQEYKELKDFKRRFKAAIRSAQQVYPSAKIEEVDGGLKLYSSPPPIRKTMVQVLDKSVKS